MKFLNLIFLVLCFNSNTSAQVNIDNISLIHITDQLNINYEEINTYTFEVRFNDSIELWYTKRISRSEFQQKIFKRERDSIYAEFFQMRQEMTDRDSTMLLYEKKKEVLEIAYQNYCDTAKAEFIKYIPEKVIVELLEGVQDSTYTEDMFKAQIELDDETSYGNFITMTSYYPLFGMTVYSSTGDTLVVYNDGQQDLMLPWRDKRRNAELYNPKINWALDAILPEDMNYNKERLVKGMNN